MAIARPAQASDLSDAGIDEAIAEIVGSDGPDGPEDGEDDAGAAPGLDDARGDGLPHGGDEGGPPPPPPAARGHAGALRPRSASAREHAEVRVNFPSGRIVYYRANGNFEAFCRLHDGRCCLTRTGLASARRARAAQGRPLGLMAAWLTRLTCVASNRAEHKDALAIASLSHQARFESRRQLRELPGGPELEALERPQRDDEPDSEPEGLA